MQETQPYLRKAQYYETDQMGIIHHANYIHWFEEARIDLMDQMGYTYARMEEDGIGSPVIGVSVEYKTPVRFGDSVYVHAWLQVFTGSRMTVGYRVTDPSGAVLHATGESRHCFTNRAGRPVSLKKANPEAYLLFEEMLADDGQQP